MRPRRQEKLGGSAAVKAAMLVAHLDWLKNRLGPASLDRLAGLPPDSAAFVRNPPLATEWLPFRCLIEIDRAIAAVVGGVEDVVYRSLGHNSAVMNLKGAYKVFLRDEPHRFFEQTALVHRRFQNFGVATYEKTGATTGRLAISGYAEFSPVYCASGLGYYEGAIETMGAPPPIHVMESQCHCAGDASCTFELGW